MVIVGTLRSANVYSRDKPSQVIIQLVSNKVNAKIVCEIFHIFRDAILSVPGVHVFTYIATEPSVKCISTLFTRAFLFGCSFATSAEI